VISPHYDPLISKLCVWAHDRPTAIERMKRALSEYSVVGIQTNLSFHKLVMDHPAFREGVYNTGFIDANKEALTVAEPEPDTLRLALAAVDAHVRTLHNGLSAKGDHVDREGTWSTWRQAARWRQRA
jgi:acetyl/propionyl-CoA carboxylase alpha subunit